MTSVTPATQVLIEVPPRSAYVGVVRLALTSLGRVTDLDDETLEDLKIAVSEACSNAVLAREGSGAGAPVSIRWAEQPDQLIVDVLDPGTDYGSPPADVLDSQGISSRQAMSLALIQSLVSDCHIGSGPDGGTRARLIVRR